MPFESMCLDCDVDVTAFGLVGIDVMLCDFTVCFRFLRLCVFSLLSFDGPLLLYPRGLWP